MSKTAQAVTLKGLSLEDRELMLTMMATLASAATTMMAASQCMHPKSHDLEGQDMQTQLDAEANAIIDICKRARERLKPGRAVILN